MSTELFDAVAAGDAARARRLATPQSLQALDAEGLTPLMRAARLGRADVVQALIECGAAVDAADERGFTALFHACHDPDEDRGRPEVVEQLIAAGADKEHRIGYGVRPLMYAAGHGETAVVEALLRAGANPLARNEGGRTALMMVKDRDYVDTINVLHWAEAQLEAGQCDSRNAPQMQVVTFRKPQKPLQ